MLGFSSPTSTRVDSASNQKYLTARLYEPTPWLLLTALVAHESSPPRWKALSHRKDADHPPPPSKRVGKLPLQRVDSNGWKREIHSQSGKLPVHCSTSSDTGPHLPPHVLSRGVASRVSGHG